MATYNGSPLSELIAGSPISDLMFGLAGNDTLKGGPGSDTLDGGKGNDSLEGGASSDTFVVDTAGDVIADSGGDNDRVLASISVDLNKDSLYGGIEHATLIGVAALNATGDAGANMLIGNAGANKLDGGLGLDTLIGGSGNDTYGVDDFFDTVVEYADGGIDLVVSSANTAFLSAFVENLTLTGPAVGGSGNSLANKIVGNSNDNLVSGDAGNDTLFGNDGLDRLDGGTGADSMVGGKGNDTYVVDDIADKVVETGGAADIDTVESLVSYTLGANVEDLFLLGALAIDGTGNSLANQIVGNGGDNLLRGMAGNDRLSGDAGDDLLIGGDGNDVLLFGAADSDKMLGGNGSDTFQAEFFVPGSSNLIADFNALPGGDQIDIASLGLGTIDKTNVGLFLSTTTEKGSTTVFVDFDGGGGGAPVALVELQGVTTDLDGLLANGSIIGVDIPSKAPTTLTSGNDPYNVAGSSELVFGLAGNDTLTGGAGSDTLDGGKGNDKLDGGAGSDTFVVDTAGDVIADSGGDNDRVLASISVDLNKDSLYGGIEHATLIGVAALNATGDGGANMLIGNAAANKLDGGLGTDTLIGGVGNDTYAIDDFFDVVTEYADGGIDLVVSSANTAFLSAFVENLTLTGPAVGGSGNSLANKIIGNSNDNLVSGDAGNDTLFGNDGLDRLDGGTGADSMVGGKGNDTYVVDDIADKVTEAGPAADIDTVESLVSYTLGANVEDLFLLGALAIDGTGDSLANQIVGNGGDNLLRGMAGNDRLSGDAGDDLLIGGDGNDVLLFGAADSDKMLGGNGSDTFQAEFFVPGSSNLIADFNALPGGDQIDIASLGLGTIDKTNVGLFLSTTTEKGSTTVFVDFDGGGGGAPVALVELQGVTTDLDGLLANGSIIGVDIPSKAPTTLTSGNDPYNVAGSSELVFGLAGNDTLTGGAGSDTLDGGKGNDKLDGGAGSDTFVVDTAGDVIADSGGDNDRVLASISVDLNKDSLYGGIEHATLIGVAALNATGDGGANMLIGNAGANKLDGGLGLDTLVGGSGNDTYGVDDFFDTVVEYADGGIDLVVSSANTAFLSAFVENLTLTGPAVGGSGNSLANKIIGNSNDNLVSGDAGNDTLFGNDGLDRLDGGTGADSMVGGKGNDTYVVDDIADKVVETGGAADIDTVESLVSYTLGANVEELFLLGSANIDGTGNSLANQIVGNGGDNLLRGMGGNDRLSGGEGDDLILGGDGNDFLEGNDDNNTLVGGGGSDFFQVGGGAVINGYDVIADFNGLPGGDILEVIAPGFDPSTSNINDFVQTRVENGSTIVSVDRDGALNGAVFIDIAELQGVSTDVLGLLNNGSLSISD